MISTVLRNQRWIKTNPCFQNPPEFSGSSVLDEFSVSPIPLPLDRVSLPSLELKLHKVLLMYPHGPGRIKLYFWTLKLAFNIPRYTQPQDFTLGGPSKCLLNWKQTSFIEVRRFSIYVKLWRVGIQIYIRVGNLEVWLVKVPSHYGLLRTWVLALKVPCPRKCWAPSKPWQFVTLQP